MPEATVISVGLIDGFSFNPFYLFNLLKNQLCYPVAIVNHLLFTRKVDQDHFDLTPVICINGTW